MLRNYYFLNRAVFELNRDLTNIAVKEVFSQDKNLLLIAIPSKDFLHRHLIISTDSSLPYILIKKDHRKAKKNVINVSSIKLPDVIKSVEIAENDRIIKIRLTNTTLVLAIMGGKSNVYFISDGKVVNQFKRTKSEDDILSRINDHKFINEPIYHRIDHEVFSSFNIKTIKNKYSFIPKEIIRELSAKNKTKNLQEDFNELLSSLYLNQINVFYDDSEKKVRFIPDGFKSSITTNDTHSFSNYNDALGKFLSIYFTSDSFTKSKKEIEKHLGRELEKLSNRLNKLEGRISSGEKSEEYYNIANLLSANRERINKGTDNIILLDSKSKKKIIIPLNPKHSAQQSIDYYFNKAKDEKINFNKSKNLFTESEFRFNHFLEIERKFESASDNKELVDIKKILKITDKKNEIKKVGHEAKLKEYLIDNKYTVLIGKDSKSNDILSIKIAKQNDYWFHARGLPGSHVVLRVDNPKEGVPKNILKIAAQLAAFHSKAKTANLAPVAYTFGKYVRKKKGMEPGKVSIMKEKVLLVKPEIPKDVEFVTED